MLRNLTFRSVLLVVLAGLMGAFAPLVPSSAQSGKPLVAVLGSVDISQEDVKTFLDNTGKFLAVDMINIGRDTPPLRRLVKYDAVLVWSDNSLGNPGLLGDILADYIDQGGGVVVAPFGFDAKNGPVEKRAIEGRFLTDNYYVIPAESGFTYGQRRTLGQVLEKDHPIMKGIKTVDGGSRSYYAPTARVTEGSTVVARWDNGDVLLAVKTIQKGEKTLRRADVNLYPASDRLVSYFWDTSSDAGDLFANALLWVAKKTGN
ncbi:hypothetical protein HYR54_08935 [Candidatus Acetothermia bacterium]|nr:hypothetical protein [Candidatus Acetothermia bacterium]MBI3460965.1 hypothetical protein [Candidatus Acetothermia bacterium]MBI3661266.1 hypothetical protein [Candidatus Acetothermia bacterium]